MMSHGWLMLIESYFLDLCTLRDMT